MVSWDLNQLIAKINKLIKSFTCVLALGSVI